MIEYGADREISALSCMTFVILTNASYESGKAGLGGVLVSPTGHFLEYFSYCLNDRELEELGANEKATIIHECEMIAVVAAFEVWEAKVRGAQVIFCLDNDRARYNLLAGVGKSKVSALIVKSFVGIEMRSKVHAWLARVPSPSNLAVLPFRGDCDYFDQRGCRKAQIDLRQSLNADSSVGVGASVIGKRGRSIYRDALRARVRLTGTSILTVCAVRVY